MQPNDHDQVRQKRTAFRELLRRDTLTVKPGHSSTQKRLVDADTIRAMENQVLPDESHRDYDGTWGHRTTFVREGAAGTTGKK